MTPAPGPISPPTGDGPSRVTETHHTSISGRVSRSRSGERERINESSELPYPNGPKTCIRCGRLLDSPDNNEPTSNPLNNSAATEPSPSSIAFATSPSLARTPNAPLLTPLLDNTTNNLNSTDQDGHQVCASCSTSNANTNVEIDNSSPIGTRSEPQLNVDDATRTVFSPTLPTDQEGDMVMEQVNNESTSVTLPTDAPIATPTRPIHPWRRPAPWANLHRDRTNSNNGSSEGPSLTISVGNMGAGGDALPAEENDDNVDFPPLARSPSSNSQIGLATSPRLPLSPTRGRTASISTSPTISQLGRQPSFSRSQSGNVAGTASSSVPVVNLSNRGRHRATSSSGSTISNIAQSVSGRGRRPSATRRLSRSSSSQGPTSVSFANIGELPSGSALNDDLFGEPIAEDPFGVSAMTRPRLSTIEPSVLAKYSQENTSGCDKMVLKDVYQKPFRLREDGVDEKSNADTAIEQELQKLRYTIWLNTSQADPRPEITRKRSTSQGRGCLFAGSTFRGTQKSGRMSYDVSVQIVNVDLAASHLCGYLNIRGLTDDWPELTTYFDAEIIGQRYGFLTNKWGATEADDLKHWSRFTPFRPIRSTLTRPGLRFNHMNKPFIFMRWKERFLVPDHRVRDISGASFAGFYYVCVELGDDSNPARQPLTSPSSPLGSPGVVPPLRSPTSTAPMEGILENASLHHQPLSPTGEAMPAHLYTPADQHTAATSGRMSGFYFHEHSEPYQQLTLRHVSESSTSTFELR